MAKSTPSPRSSIVHLVWDFLRAQNILAIFLIILMVAAIRYPIDYRRIMGVTDNDYSTHIYYGLDMLHGRPVPAFTLAHSFWQLGLIFMWWASRSRVDFWQSAILFQVLSAVASALIVYFWFGTLPSRPSPWKRLFWAVSLVVVTPVIAPHLLDGAYYFGYIGLANYHNPTVHMLRPFALLMFMFAMQVLGGEGTSSRRKTGPLLILLAALIYAAATFLKPSYTVTLLPALGVMGLYWLWKRRPVNWALAVLGIGIPSVLLLAPQFVITYVRGEIDGGIAIMPFEAARMLSGYIPLKFLMSIFFPLIVTILFRKQVWKDMEMVLGWLAFAVGSLQYFLLIELGSRFTHANFIWGAQITLFMLFVVTIRFLLKQEDMLRKAASPALWLSYAAYLPHLLSGMAYYIFCFVTPHYG